MITPGITVHGAPEQLALTLDAQHAGVPPVAPVPDLANLAGMPDGPPPVADPLINISAWDGPGMDAYFVASSRAPEPPEKQPLRLTMGLFLLGACAALLDRLGGVQRYRVAAAS
ncbi:hypothetical protein [Actinacidiphila soli]|uniref:hypothetical protein n=1 Tax=Actinacidiphila soli TaxID=2487275 RepID=UPI000FC9F797|nr:hypothetical protein [Actinacidiphila soli]